MPVSQPEGDYVTTDTTARGPARPEEVLSPQILRATGALDCPSWGRATVQTHIVRGVDGDYRNTITGAANSGIGCFFGSRLTFS